MTLANPAAERMLLGSLLIEPAAIPRVLEKLAPDDLTGSHVTILAAMAKLAAGDKPVDLVTVTDELRRLGRADSIRNGAYLHDLMAAVPVAAMVDTYVEPIVTMRRRRELLEVAQRLIQQAESDTADHEMAIIEGVGKLDRLAGSREVDSSPSITAEDLVAVPDCPPDWIFEGILETEDRLLITCGEGGGKSVLVRQFAVCAAAGVHPFTGQRIRPRRVLMVDCENSVNKTRRHMRRLLNHAATIGRPTGNRLKLEIRPGGLDLTSTHDAAWLLDRATVNQPELLTVGPLYRLYDGDPNDERTARQVSRALDAARLRCGAALITETHAGHGQSWQKERDLRPKGSSLWRAWPDSIRGLRPQNEGDATVMDVEFAGRGDREERDWPPALRHGRKDEWPWMDNRVAPPLYSAIGASA